MTKHKHAARYPYHRPPIVTGLSWYEQLIACTIGPVIIAELAFWAARFL